MYYSFPKSRKSCAYLEYLNRLESFIQLCRMALFLLSYQLPGSVSVRLSHPEQSPFMGFSLSAPVLGAGSQFLHIYEEKNVMKRPINESLSPGLLVSAGQRTLLCFCIYVCAMLLRTLDCLPETGSSSAPTTSDGKWSEEKGSQSWEDLGGGSVVGRRGHFSSSSPTAVPWGLASCQAVAHPSFCESSRWPVNQEQ